MNKIISVLGSTGSIGTQTLDVARKHEFKISALTAHRNSKLIEQQAREFHPRLIVLTDETAAHDLKINLRDTDIKVLTGEDGLLEAAAEPSCDTVVNALVGIAGLIPTIKAVEAKKNIALANKETLVTGGSLVMSAVAQNEVKLYPVDSEHSAIFQCLQGCPENSLKKIILTASGGPFFGKNKEELCNVTVSQALAHPNWSMGAKITVDSATMMNKGFEIIEAAHLFNLESEYIDVLVHRESIVHSMIELRDNAILAQLGTPDMRIPIQYALTYPQRYDSPASSLNFLSYASLTFLPPDEETFPAMSICRNALKHGGIATAAINGANEIAVAAFLNGKITFNQITETVNTVFESISHIEKLVFGSEDLNNLTLKSILKTDEISREFARSYLKL